MFVRVSILKLGQCFGWLWWRKNWVEKWSSWFRRRLYQFCFPAWMSEASVRLKGCKNKQESDRSPPNITSKTQQVIKWKAVWIVEAQQILSGDKSLTAAIKLFSLIFCLRRKESRTSWTCNMLPSFHGSLFHLSSGYQCLKCWGFFSFYFLWVPESPLCCKLLITFKKGAKKLNVWTK